MKKFTKIAAAAAIAAIAGTSTAQVSNTVYFDKYNYRQHHVNPAFIPDQTVYVSIVGNVAIEAGNNSLTFGDLFKNINTPAGKRTALFLDKDVKNGKSDFLDAMRKKLHVYNNLYIDLLDIGFRVGDNTYIALSSGVKTSANLFLPKKFFELALKGMEEDEEFDLEASSISAGIYGYAEFAATVSHKFNDKLNIGVTGKFLQGFAGMKTDFSDLKVQGSMDEWRISGKTEVMGAFPGLEVTKDEKNELKFEHNDDITASDFRGNNGFAIDLGASYKITDKLTLSASLIDLGFIKFSNGVARVSQTQDFVFDGGKFDISENSDVDFDEFKDSFNDAFDPGSTKAFTQTLNTKFYAGASYDLCKPVSVGFLSKTSFFNGNVWEDMTLHANIHPIRMFSLNTTYTIFDGKWNAIGLGVNINLGPLNIFAAADNIPFHVGKTDDGVTFPDRSKFTRVNVGLGLVFGSKEKKDKKAKEKEDDAPGIEKGFPEPDFFDADGDGVEDSKDNCAETPKDVEVDEDGCPLDNDKDGVPDYLDKCPDTAEGTPVDENGCALDNDGDGVNDNLDKCPNTPQGVEVDRSGCPVDTDNDGVPDYLDKCPNTPSSAKADENGCPVDTDGDGVPDYLDHCPDVAGIASNYGCPEVKQEVKQLFRKALNGIQFATGKSTILASSYGILNDIAKTMQDNPDYKLFIKGHTDNVGDADKNLQLSKDRAEAVRKYLIGKGVPESRMHSEGYGDTMPVVPNNSAANKAKNRRVEFEVEF